MTGCERARSRIAFCEEMARRYADRRVRGFWLAAREGFRRRLMAMTIEELGEYVYV